ncbi:hypothetical protein RB195_023282 [Necator americanus]|uniref:Integrase catalytic domain-containing protein n=1 Tax=Necator americanus TaxID=51031 RepID=A0ABR1EJG5_NECAM
MSSSSTTATLRELKMLFARFGNPRMIVSDNGTQFTAKEFQEFSDKQGIEDARSPPFHPRSNGQVEPLCGHVEKKPSEEKGGRYVEETSRIFAVLSTNTMRVNAGKFFSSGGVPKAPVESG